MSTINCPAPGCSTSWSATINLEILLHLIELHARTAHPVTVPSPAPAIGDTPVEKVTRPMISAGVTNKEWAYFEQRWLDYKAATRLADSDIAFQLLECCDEELRKDIFRTFGSLASSDEHTILINIKSLAVHQENIMVARPQLQQLRQDRDEPVLPGPPTTDMSTIPCPAPGCSTSWSATINLEILLHLIELHARTSHPVTRPMISAGVTNKEWSYFEQRWSNFKAATRLADSDIAFQLLECCDKELRKDIFRTFGSLASSDEHTILMNIKSLAVRQENFEDRDEPESSSSARFKKYGKYGAYALGGVFGGVAAVALAPVALTAAGFTSAGVAAGSLAATAMSLSGPIASGSVIATLQSAGAAGIGGAASTLIAGGGAAAGTGLAHTARKIFNRKKQNSEPEQPEPEPEPEQPEPEPEQSKSEPKQPEPKPK